MEEVRITFKDGTEVEATLNGNTYIVDEKPSFPEDLSEVTVSDSEGKEETIQNAQITECAAVDTRYWFTITETPQSEIEKEKADAQIMYTALMTDTLIEEE